MIRNLVLLAALAALPTINAAAQERVVVFETGNSLVQYMPEYERLLVSDGDADLNKASKYVSYITGVYDAMASMRSACVGRGSSRGQLAAVVSRWLKAHPKRWSEPAVNLVAEALREAFACEAPSLLMVGPEHLR